MSNIIEIKNNIHNCSRSQIGDILLHDLVNNEEYLRVFPEQNGNILEIDSQRRCTIKGNDKIHFIQSGSPLEGIVIRIFDAINNSSASSSPQSGSWPSRTGSAINTINPATSPDSVDLSGSFQQHMGLDRDALHILQQRLDNIERHIGALRGPYGNGFLPPNSQVPIYPDFNIGQMLFDIQGRLSHLENLLNTPLRSAPGATSPLPNTRPQGHSGGGVPTPPQAHSGNLGLSNPPSPTTRSQDGSLPDVPTSQSRRQTNSANPSRPPTDTVSGLTVQRDKKPQNNAATNEISELTDLLDFVKNANNTSVNTSNNAATDEISELTEVEKRLEAVREPPKERLTKLKAFLRARGTYIEDPALHEPKGSEDISSEDDLQKRFDSLRNATSGALESEEVTDSTNRFEEELNSLQRKYQEFQDTSNAGLLRSQEIINSLRTRTQDLDNQIFHLTRKLQRSQDGSKELHVNLENERFKKDQLLKLKYDAEEQKRIALEDLEAAKASIVAMQSHNELQLSHMRADLENATRTIASQQDALNAANQKLQLANKNQAHLKEQITNLKRQHEMQLQKTQTNANQQKGKTLADLKQKLTKNFNARLSELEMALATAKQRAQVEKEGSMHAFRRLKEQLKKSTDQLESRNQQYQELLQQNDTLRQNLEHEISIKEQALAKKSHLEAQIQTLQQNHQITLGNLNKQHAQALAQQKGQLTTASEAHLKQELEKQKETLNAGFEQQHNALRLQLSTVQSQTKEKLQTAAAEIAAITNQLRATEQSLTESRQLTDSQRIQIERLKAQVLENSAAAEADKRAIETLQRENIQLNQDKQREAARAKELSSEVAQLQQELTNRTSTSTSELELVRSQLSQKNQEIHTLVTSLQEQRDIAYRDGQLNADESLTQALSKARLELEHKIQKIEELQPKVDQLNAQVTQLTTDLESYKKASESVEELRTSEAASKEALSKAQATIRDLTQKQHQLQTKLTDTEQDLEISTQRHTQELENQRTMHMRESTQQQAQITTLSQQVSGLATEYENTNDELYRVNHLLVQAKQRIADIEAEAEETQEKRKKAETALGNLRSELKDILRFDDSASDRDEDLIDSIRNLIRDFSEQNSTIKRLQHETKRLRDRLVSTPHPNALSESASTYAESSISVEDMRERFARELPAIFHARKQTFDDFNAEELWEKVFRNRNSVSAQSVPTSPKAVLARPKLSRAHSLDLPRLALPPSPSSFPLEDLDLLFRVNENFENDANSVINDAASDDSGPIFTPSKES